MKYYTRARLFIAAGLILFTCNLKAQSTLLDKDGYISLGPQLSLPIGGMHDRYQWGLGASIQADIPLIDQLLFVTANLGFSNFYARSSALALVSNLRMLPVKVGFKLFPIDNFYFQASMGAGFLLNKTRAGYDRSTSFIYAPQVGYQFKVAKTDVVDLGINFQRNTRLSAGGSNNSTFGLRIAYGLGL